MSDDIKIEEARIRAAQEKMDEAFCDAMHRAIRTGQETVPTVVSRAPGTQRPIVVLASQLLLP
jgi:hypothetical protein